MICTAYSLAFSTQGDPFLFIIILCTSFRETSHLPKHLFYIFLKQTGNKSGSNLTEYSPIIFSERGMRKDENSVGRRGGQEREWRKGRRERDEESGREEVCGRRRSGGKERVIVWGRKGKGNCVWEERSDQGREGRREERRVGEGGNIDKEKRK